MDASGIVTAVIASVGVTVAIITAVWRMMASMSRDIKDDANRAHTAIRNNIETVRKETRKDIGRVRESMDSMNQTLINMNGRLGNVEGYMEAVKQNITSK